MKFKYVLLMMCSSGILFAANSSEQALPSQSSGAQKVLNAKKEIRRLQHVAFQEEVQNQAGFKPNLGDPYSKHIRPIGVDRKGPRRERLQALLAQKRAGGLIEKRKS